LDCGERKLLPFKTGDGLEARFSATDSRQRTALRAAAGWKTYSCNNPKQWLCHRRNHAVSRAINEALLLKVIIAASEIYPSLHILPLWDPATDVGTGKETAPLAEWISPR
jgi:hypothetical protein